VRLAIALALACGCSVSAGRNDDLAGAGGDDLAGADLAYPERDLYGLDFAGGCVEGTQGCYTVYAHGDHVLYKLDLANKDLVTVGPFKAPNVSVNGQMVEDVITDLAVAPDNTIWVVSHTKLYTADAKDGHVTLVGNVTSCGVAAVALSFGLDGTLYEADFQGAFCRIDLTVKPPKVVPIGTIGGGLAISGDLVAVGDGTMYGTAYTLADYPSGPTVTNNLLVKIDPKTGQSTVIGSTGFPRLYGAAYELGKVFAFTHSGSGQVVTIDPTTGKGTLYNTFTDPMTRMGIAFAGAGVNPMVAPIGARGGAGW
jgi:hypothetical protein